MFLESNYSITRLFLDKTVTIIVREEEKAPISWKFNLILKPIKEMFLNDQWNISYHLLTNSDYKNMMLLKKDVNISSFEAIKLLLCDLGKYDKFRLMADALIQSLGEIIPNLEIDFQNRELKIDNHIITEEIWEYVLYLLKLSYGEKVTPPLTFDSEEARKFYLAQKAAEERIKKIKGAKAGDIDSLSKMMLSITYAFPSFSFEYLWDQTLAQILWLQKYAAGAMSYEVNAQAFAAGNVKKGKKLDFFIK